MMWAEYNPNRRPPANIASARDTWEQVKRERGWEQKPGETVAEMDVRLGTGLSPLPMTYSEYLQSSLWRKKRNEALRRAGHKCEQCGATRSLEVHHLNYDRLGRERPSDLKVLCVKCHPGADAERETAQGTETFAQKKYGDDWHDRVSEEAVADEFDAWRERKGEA